MYKHSRYREVKRKRYGYASQALLKYKLCKSNDQSNQMQIELGFFFTYTHIYMFLKPVNSDMEMALKKIKNVP